MIKLAQWQHRNLKMIIATRNTGVCNVPLGTVINKEWYRVPWLGTLHGTGAIIMLNGRPFPPMPAFERGGGGYD